MAFYELYHSWTRRVFAFRRKGCVRFCLLRTSPLYQSSFGECSFICVPGAEHLENSKEDAPAWFMICRAYIIAYLSPSIVYVSHTNGDSMTLDISAS